MSDLTSRPDHWTDYLPQNWQQSINTNPMLNALGRALSRPAADLTRGIEDQYGSIADKNWLEQASAGGPPRLNPLAAEILDKGGMIANFVGPGVKAPRKFSTFSLDYYGTPVRIMQNPTDLQAAVFMNRTKYKAARRIVDPATGDTFIWDANDPALHAMVAKQLGIAEGKFDMIGFD